MTNENLYSDVVTGIVTVLRANISDPDTVRSGANKKFIYDRFPHAATGMPRISVTVLPHGDTNNLDIISNDELIRLQVQIDIWTDLKSTYTIGAGGSYNKSKLLDYLAGHVSKVMKTQGAALKTYNIHNVIRTRPFGAMDAGADNLMRSLGEYEITYHQTYS